MNPAALVQAARNLGGELLLADDGRIRFSGPDTAEWHALIEQLRSYREDVIRILRQQNSWPVPLSYPEYFCRMREAGFAPCSREEWEAEHGSDAERMARYERLCRWGASGDAVQRASADAETAAIRRDETEFLIANHEGEDER